MSCLYPEIEPFAIHEVAVSDTHRLYVEESGNPSGLPVLFLHGGPGSGCSPYHRCFFDPEIYRIILFDQRGCGRSRPHAELIDNTTWHLVDDIEVIRQTLAIDQWVVFGGSWGTTLGLAYAEKHPQRVFGLILRGIFLCRDEEIQWFYQDGASRVFSDYWEGFLRPIPVEERGNLLQAYYKRLTGEDEIARMAAAKAWSAWEGRTASLFPDDSILDFFSEPSTALSIARIECHYFVNHAFLEPNQLLRNIHRIADIPGVIVHGRYDLICPMQNAWDLHHAWPISGLNIIPDAGHSATEPGITQALVTATDQMAASLV